MTTEFPQRKSAGKPANHSSKTLLLLSLVAVGISVISYFLLKSNGLAATWNFPGFVTVIVMALIVMCGVWLFIFILVRPKMGRQKPEYGPNPPYSAKEYAAVGLGPVADSMDSKHLYIDLVKRSVANILYEDRPVLFYDQFIKGTGLPELAREFNLERRVHGEDEPTQAHTMVGIKRLENLQQCIEDVIANNIPGDLIETGSYRGGATIFMRAVLKAHQVVNRRVFVCDAFLPMKGDLPPWFLMPLLQGVAAVPGRTNKNRLFAFLESLPQEKRAFPVCENPNDDWIDYCLWSLRRHPKDVNCGDTTSRAHVESRFARYGLLDDQVVFLEGFFADTLPNAPIEKLSLIRLDGDTYESTRDGIENLYPKLSPGGYCIIDDFNAFDGCKRAVTEYREKNNIQEPIVAIDNIAVFWKKSLEEHSHPETQDQAQHFEESPTL